MKGNITYRFESSSEERYTEDILYLNLIKKYGCNNNCRFCSRPRDGKKPNKLTIYEEKAGVSLYLPRSPSIDKIMENVNTDIKPNDKEFAVVGVGEPSLYLPKLIKIIKKVKEKYNIKTRIDTNGLLKCIYDNPVKKLEEAGLDRIWISLNEVNEKEYNRLCRPEHENAFPNLIDFIQECNNSTIDTYVSFVINFEDEVIRSRIKEEYIDFTLSIGINQNNIIFRNHVKPR